jgi:hypothetical protein
MTTTAAATTPSPFAEHDASSSNALCLSIASFQMRATSANLPTGNCGQVGTRPCLCGEDSARMTRPPEFFLPCAQWRRTLAAPPAPRASRPPPPRPCAPPPPTIPDVENPPASLSPRPHSPPSSSRSRRLRRTSQRKRGRGETASTSSVGGRGCSSSSTGASGSTRRCCSGGPCQTQERRAVFLVRAI